MKLDFKFVAILCITLISLQGRSQEYIADKPYRYMVGLYWNAVDDDGRPFKDLLKFRPVWNMFFLPCSASFDYHIEKGFSAEALLNFNRYNPANHVNRGVFDKRFFFNIDVNAKYSFGGLMKQPFWDPFVFGGLSYTLRPPNIWRHMLSPNIGVGFNFFLRPDLAIQLRTAAKISVVPEFFTHHSNYLHHHFGVVYILEAMPWNDDFSKKKYKWLFKDYKWKGNTL